MSEQETRLRLLNTLLTTPHRALEALYPLHQEMCTQDPRFYVQLAAWYFDHGDVRDHKELFVIALTLSSFPGHRDVGLALLRRLAPYQVARIVAFIKGYRVRPAKEKAAPAQGKGKRRASAAPKPKETAVAVAAKPPVEWAGLRRNIPRSLATEIRAYLREREQTAAKLDRVLLHARGPMKQLYASLHIKPHPRAQATLFDGIPPKGSQAARVREIAKLEDPLAQAQAIVAAHLPYRVAVSIIRQMTPTALAALIDAMTPAEVINNLKSLKRRGALENADLKTLIDGKLEAAKTDKRVSAYKAKVAAAAAEVEPDLAEQLEAVTEAQVKTRGRITRATALFVDKSESMGVALQVGKQIGAMVSAICDAPLYAYAFDEIAYPIEPKGASLADWGQAFQGLQARGATSCGVALEWMHRRQQRVEQIIIVTDEGENRAPHFRPSYVSYAEALQVQPDVHIVKVSGAGGMTNKLEVDCQALGIAPNVVAFTGDYYALTNLIPFLTKASPIELVMEIMAYPLPQRKAA